MTTERIWFYPALIAVLGQDRRPSFAEMRNLVKRVRLEMIEPVPRSALRRQHVRRLVKAVLAPKRAG
jgi:hypothetical protein